MSPPDRLFSIHHLKIQFHRTTFQYIMALLSSDRTGAKVVMPQAYLVVRLKQKFIASGAAAHPLTLILSLLSDNSYQITKKLRWVPIV